MKKGKKNIAEGTLPGKRVDADINKNQSGSDFTMSEADIMKLLHELEVHRIELEKQNKELELAKEMAEFAAKQYGDLFEEIFEFSPAGYITLDREGTIYELNSSGANILGKKRGELENADLRLFVSQDSLSVLNEFLTRLFKTNHKQTCEVSFLAKEKPSLYVYIEGIVTGNSEKCLLTLIDISERKQAEEALAKAANQWQITFDALNDGVCLLGTDHRILRCNKAMVDLFPESGYEMIGKPCWEIVHGTPEPHEYCPLNNMMKSFKRESADINIAGKWFEVTVDPFFDNDNLLAGAVHIVRDITDKKVSLENLLRSEEIFRKAFKLHPGMVGISTIKDGKYIEINQHFTEILGWEHEEVIGKTAFELGLYADFNQRSEMLSLIEQKGSVKDYEVKLRTKAGEVRIGLFSAETIVMGQKECLLVQVSDVTERIRAEKALKESEIRLTELNATKDRFFSIIAHDLKSPFNNILGFSNLLADLVKDKSNNEIVEYAEIIKNASEQAMDLLLNLLEWSRMQTGRIPFNPEAIDIVRLVHEACKLSDVTARLKSIGIIEELPEKLIAFADKAMIGAVMRNLISNAVKYTNSGGYIVVSAQMPVNELLVSVSDNGVGISKTALEKLFRIEESISTKGTRNEKGTGLGLLLCKEFVEKHGGRIWVESESGKGSTFYFTIPMKGSIQV
ncbi:MAG: PAS domain-containing sensor histidine kinase [Bacteroidales bacterium]|nr:PAS domain-containing sensor histidine kinase [Bacteroidales bacterium]